MGLPKPEHAPSGDPCDKCGRAAFDHRAPRKRMRRERKDERTEDDRMTFLGIDGEGQGRRPHRYTMMGCSDELGERKWVLRPDNGTDLTTVECLEFLCSLPRQHTKIFAYSFGYDLTMMLRCVPDHLLYYLFRPDLRRGKHGPKPVYWRTVTTKGEEVSYALNLLATRFTVRRSVPGEFVDLVDRRGHAARFPKMGPSRVVNDVWKFFQGRFTAALTDWKVGSPEAVERMEQMKRRRSDFDKLAREEGPEAIEAYCLEECRYMAELARKLTDAHVKVGLKLRSYFGAGSSASALLEAMGVKAHIKESRIVRSSKDPPELAGAIASAFFGGRFENSRAGRVAGPVHSYDISSAYPYELTSLPCWIHGRWRKTKNRSLIERARTALVRYELEEPRSERELAWAPFPFRMPDGSIVYPRASGGGWIWREEFLAGERLFPNVRFREAWAYQCECDCVPFLDVPTYYRERVRIGKEGPGIVIKLGTNSCYGKLAQSVGGQLGGFTNFAWAGLVTSGTRGKLLADAIGAVIDVDPWSLLMCATDGTAFDREVSMPAPKDTGTFDCRNAKGEHVPLGGWEYKKLDGGIFLARPGVYFEPVERSELEMKYVRGRGVGRAAMVANAQRIVEAYERGDKSIVVTSFDRFVGAKTAISRGGEPGKWRYKRSVACADWIDRPVEMTFDPQPKREGIGEGGRLGLRAFPSLESRPYERGLVGTGDLLGDDSAEAALLRAMAQEAGEQPDGGQLSESFDE